MKYTEAEKKAMRDSVMRTNKPNGNRIFTPSEASALAKKMNEIGFLSKRRR